MNLTNQIRKALLVSAFFYALSPSLASASCVLPVGSEAAQVKHIVDGDTLKLQNGVSVRMLGINTPETARRGVPAQPLALQATQALKDLLSENIYLVDGDQPQDHYGRRLSHVFSATGRSAEETLISQGLGFFIGSDDATGMATCLRAAEQQAREAKRGVWGDPYWTPKAFNSQDLRAGFVVLEGTISSIEKSSKAVWLETSGDVVLRVDRRDMSRFQQQWWQQLEGRRVMVKGWMVDRKGRQGPHKRWLVRLMYPDMLVLLD
jgi:endonuclease YncB( thermonuclease family)